MKVGVVRAIEAREDRVALTPARAGTHPAVAETFQLACVPAADAARRIA